MRDREQEALQKLPNAGGCGQALPVEQREPQEIEHGSGLCGGRPHVLDQDLGLELDPADLGQAPGRGRFRRADGQALKAREGQTAGAQQAQRRRASAALPGKTEPAPVGTPERPRGGRRAIACGQQKQDAALVEQDRGGRRARRALSVLCHGLRRLALPRHQRCPTAVCGWNAA
jgi:hypothetical protein